MTSIFDLVNCLITSQVQALYFLLDDLNLNSKSLYLYSLFNWLYPIQMALSSRSFDHIMDEVYQMKEDLLRLHFIYSPQTPNYHHLQQIAQLQQQVQLSQDKLAQFHNQLNSNRQHQEHQLKQLQKQNQELLIINEQLVVSNDKFKRLLEQAQTDREQLARELKHQLQARKNLELKHQKEIENLKLMQAQELYILKKKEKKG